MRLFLISFCLLAGNAMAACPALLDRKMDTIHEKPQSLCEYAGKVVLVVNTASECGYTPQYEGLETLYRKYRERGLVVLGFPANDFGGQEPGSNKEIAAFCEMNYGVSFPMFSKIEVNGPNAHPLYQWLKEASDSGDIEWNFVKFLVDRDGELLRRYPPKAKPEDIAADIDAVL
jgi:glutathione peroxidase